MRRINPFDWHAEFPRSSLSRKKEHSLPLDGEGRGWGEGDGGFDAVIGNPPVCAAGIAFRLQGLFHYSL